MIEALVGVILIAARTFGAKVMPRASVKEERLHSGLCSFGRPT
jgi:hypothetical protein